MRENHKIDNRGEFLDFLSSPCGQENRRNRWQWCSWQCYVGDLMIVIDLRCSWQNLFSLLVIFFKLKSLCIKSVTNFSNLSPTHSVSNIRHQNQCNRRNHIEGTFVRIRKFILAIIVCDFFCNFLGFSLVIRFLFQVWKRNKFNFLLSPSFAMFQMMKFFLRWSRPRFILNQNIFFFQSEKYSS